MLLGEKWVRFGRHPEIGSAGKGTWDARKSLQRCRSERKRIRAYWIRKICCVLAAGMIGILLAAVSFGWSSASKRGRAGSGVAATSYGKGNRTEALEAEIDGVGAGIEITVRERAYTEAEKQQHLGKRLF